MPDSGFQIEVLINGGVQLFDTTTPPCACCIWRAKPGDDRTGVFTSGIISTQQGQRIALYFTARQHVTPECSGTVKVKDI